VDGNGSVGSLNQLFWCIVTKKLRTQCNHTACTTLLDMHQLSGWQWQRWQPQPTFLVHCHQKAAYPMQPHSMYNIVVATKSSVPLFIVISWTISFELISTISIVLISSHLLP
jgi:hypothetical protein